MSDQNIPENEDSHKPAEAEVKEGGKEGEKEGGKKVEKEGVKKGEMSHEEGGKEENGPKESKKTKESKEGGDSKSVSATGRKRTINPINGFPLPLSEDTPIGTAADYYYKFQKEAHPHKTKTELVEEWKELSMLGKLPYLSRAAKEAKEFTNKFNMTPTDWLTMIKQKPRATTMKRKAAQISSAGGGTGGGGNTTTSTTAFLDSVPIPASISSSVAGTTLGELLQKNRMTTINPIGYLVERFRLDQKFFKGSAVHISSKTIDPNLSMRTGARHKSLIQQFEEFAKAQQLTFRIETAQYPDEQDIEHYVFDATSSNLLTKTNTSGGSGVAPMDTTVDAETDNEEKNKEEKNKNKEEKNKDKVESKVTKPSDDLGEPSSKRPRLSTAATAAKKSNSDKTTTHKSAGAKSAKSSSSSTKSSSSSASSSSLPSDSDSSDEDSSSSSSKSKSSRKSSSSKHDDSDPE